MGWIPAIAFTSVDLPAPLSPTNAVTSPGYTWKSTSCKTCTTPKLLLTPLSSRMGAVGVTSSGIGRSEPRCGADRRELAGTHLVLGLTAILEDDVDVVLRDRLRDQENRWHIPVALVVARGGVGADGLALDERDRGLGQRVGFLLRGLVDGHTLRSGKDVLQTLDGRVLTRDRHQSCTLVLLQDRDDRSGQPVVRGVDAVDLAVSRGVHLLEDGDGLVVVPVRHRLLTDDLDARRLVDRRVRTGREQGGVVVGGRTVEEHHVRRLPAKAVDQALALELTDFGVVERDLNVAPTTESQSVVVDGLDPLAGRLLLNGGAAVGVEVHDREHGHAVGDHSVGDGGHGVGRTLGVLDRVRDAGRLEGRLERRSVLGLPSDRRFGVGQDHPDLALGLASAIATAAIAAATPGQGDRRSDEHGEHQRSRSLHGDRSQPSDLLFGTTYSVTHITSRKCTSTGVSEHP